MSDDAASASDNSEIGTVSETGKDGTGERSERELLRLFIGRNAEPFLRIHDANSKPGKFKWAGWASVNFAAGFLGLPWFFYRKLYLEGAALLIIPIVIIFLLPGIEDKIRISTTGAMLAIANYYYVTRALAKVRKIESLHLSDMERDARITEAGGTSIAGAVLGTLIILGVIATIFLSPNSGQAAALPACDSKAAQKLATKAIMNGFTKKGLSTDGLKLSNFESIQNTGPDLRSCRVIISQSKASKHLTFLIEWVDDKKSQYRLEFSSPTGK